MASPISKLKYGSQMRGQLTFRARQVRVNATQTVQTLLEGEDQLTMATAVKKAQALAGLAPYRGSPYNNMTRLLNKHGLTEDQIWVAERVREERKIS